MNQPPSTTVASSGDTQDVLGLLGLILENKYQLLEVVGSGGFAVVYRAEHLIWKRPVAIKCFVGLSQAAPELRDTLMNDFLTEGALLTELSSQTASIVQARDIGALTTPDGRWVPYMVLEWLQGVSLETWLAQTPSEPVTSWSPEAALRLLRPICAALKIAHGRGVAHRDIKPANLFVMEGDPREGDCTIKILDFGVAKVVGGHQEFTVASTRTGIGVNSFTPAYGAPEQFSRTFGATGPWTDVYALALLAVELLTGHPALDGDDVAQLAYASTVAPRPTPLRRGRDLGQAVESVFERALAVNPAQRQRNAADFINELETALRSGGTPTMAVARPGQSGASEQATLVAASNTARSASKGRSGRLAWLSLGLVALVALVAVALRSKSRDLGDSVASAAPVPSASATVVAAPTPEPECPRDMVKIPAGQLFVGSDGKDALPNEQPVHNARLSVFCFDRTEVTVAAYKACSDEGRCLPASKEVRWPGSERLSAGDLSAYSSECNLNHVPDRLNHPINCVDYAMAQRFCQMHDKRLPTEAEWEYATRGPDGRKYPWGDDPPTVAHLNACDAECMKWHRKNRIAQFAPTAPLFTESDGYATTAPVGSFKPGSSRFGAEDVVGNVWEWVADWYAPYEARDQVNPTGPASGQERVMRGGGFNGLHANWLRPSFRFKFDPTARSWVVGFRCAKSLGGRP